MFALISRINRMLVYTFSASRFAVALLAGPPLVAVLTHMYAALLVILRRLPSTKTGLPPISEPHSVIGPNAVPREPLRSMPWPRGTSVSTCDKNLDLHLSCQARSILGYWILSSTNERRTPLGPPGSASIEFNLEFHF